MAEAAQPTDNEVTVFSTEWPRELVNSHIEAEPRPMPAKKRLLIVEGDNLQRTIYSTVASTAGFSAKPVSSLEEAEAALRVGPVHCVLLDLMLGARSGMEVLEVIGGLAEKPRVILVTAAAQDLVNSAIRYGDDLGIDMSGSIRKPVDIALLRSDLRRIGIAIDMAPQGPGAGGPPVGLGSR